MGRDIIFKTTMKFIMSEEKHLALALQVEKVMPHVKKKLIKDVKEGIRNRLEQWDGNENWEVVSGTNRNVFVLKRKDWPEGRGIDLSGNLPPAVDLCDYLQVSLPDGIDVKKFKGEFEKHINQLTYRAGNGIFQKIIDWDTEEDLTKAMRKDEMVTELIEQIKDWAIAVDKALGDLKEGGENRA